MPIAIDVQDFLFAVISFGLTANTTGKFLLTVCVGKSAAVFIGESANKMHFF